MQDEKMKIVTREWTRKGFGHFECRLENEVLITICFDFDTWKWVICQYGIRIARGKAPSLSLAKDEAERIYKSEIRRNDIIGN